MIKSLISPKNFYLILLAITLLLLFLTSAQIQYSFDDYDQPSPSPKTLPDELDCCVDECSGKLEIPLAPNCPTQYLSFAPYGQFNNCLRSLVSMLLIGIKSKRTVIIPDIFGFDWLKMINLDRVCVKVMSEDQLREFLRSNGARNRVKTFRWNEGYPVGDYYGRKTQKFEVDIDSLNHADSLCIGQTIKGLQDDLIFMSSPFFSKIKQVDYKHVMKHITFTKPVEEACAKYRNDVFKGKPYVGIHLRGLDGDCTNRQKKIFVNDLEKYLDTGLQQCDMKWEYTSRVIRSYGFDPDKVQIYFSDDQQRPDISKIYSGKSNVYMWDTGLDHNADPSMMDMCLLSHSSLFIGNPYSSFSFNVAIMRENNGHSNTTNVLAGYREIGYQHHLFLDTFN